MKIEITRWAGNKDVVLGIADLETLPHAEDQILFQSEGNVLQGKVTRITHDLVNKKTLVRVVPRKAKNGEN